MQKILCTEPQYSSMSYRTADQTAQHIASACIGGKKLRFVSDQHHAGTDMVCQDSHGSGQLLIFLILCTGSLLNISNNRCKQVNSVYIPCTVQESKNSLKSPAGIYVFLL